MKFARKTVLGIFTLLLTFPFIATSATAATISFATTVLDTENDLWQIDYKIDDFDATMSSGYEIIFDYGLYENITLTGSSAEWDALILQPDLIEGVGDDGILDALAPSGTGLMSANFSLTVNWLGDGTPASQEFNLYHIDGDDYDSYEIVSSGTTSPVPEPSTLMLMFSGLACTVFLRKK